MDHGNVGIWRDWTPLKLEMVLTSWSSADLLMQCYQVSSAPQHLSKKWCASFRLMLHPGSLIWGIRTPWFQRTGLLQIIAWILFWFICDYLCNFYFPGRLHVFAFWAWSFSIVGCSRTNRLLLAGLRPVNWMWNQHKFTTSLSIIRLCVPSFTSSLVSVAGHSCIRWGALHWQGGFTVECSQAKFLSQLRCHVWTFCMHCILNALLQFFEILELYQDMSGFVLCGSVWPCVFSRVGLCGMCEPCCRFEFFVFLFGETLGIHSLSLRLQWK